MSKHNEEKCLQELINNEAIRTLKRRNNAEIKLKEAELANSVSTIHSLEGDLRIKVGVIETRDDDIT